MRVVVTGATGNVGTSLVERLAADDLASVFAGADAAVHVAWLFQPTHTPEATWRDNVLGSMRVVEAVAAAGVGTLVHASSVGAYSPAPGSGSVDGSWPTNALPTAAHGREK